MQACSVLLGNWLWAALCSLQPVPIHLATTVNALNTFACMFVTIYVGYKFNIICVFITSGSYRIIKLYSIDRGKL